MTLQQMEHYLAQSHAYRGTWPEPDVTLELLRKMLFTYFGAKDPPSSKEFDDKVKTFAKPIVGDDRPSNFSSGAQLTKEEKDAWIAAGMPSPFRGWIERFRHGSR